MPSIFLQVLNITKTFITKNLIINALKGVSLDIYKGEIVSLLGVNGAGKTTLSSIIATLHPATSGDVLVEGKSIYKNIIKYRHKLGFVPQKPNFDRLLTVKDNLIFAGHYFLIPPQVIKERVDVLLEQFGLDRYANSTADILSGGYKQRLLIARALMHEPSLLILDEPTVALDPQVRRQLWEKILELKKQGVTIILTTHYLDEAEYLSDRVCILDKGIVRLIDKPKNLLSTYNKNKLEDVFIQLLQENHE
ncbi:MAG: ABC transporter ATP-binding protein [Candidatus Babeliaceae bacterium]